MESYLNRGGMHDDSDTMIDYAFGLSTKYGEAAAAMTAEWYDAIAKLSKRYINPAEPAEPASFEEVERAIWGALKEKSSKAISGAVERLVKRAGVDTTMKNAIRDGAEWAWIPSGDTCAFCLTLASNGWQRASQSALRGGHADHIHAHCDCTYAIRFNDDMNYDGYNPDVYKDIYDDADGTSSNDKINSIRRSMYQLNKDKINAQKRAAYAERKEDSTDDDI